MLTPNNVHFIIPKMPYLTTEIGNTFYLATEIGNTLYLATEIGNILYLATEIGNTIYLATEIGNTLYRNSSGREMTPIQPDTSLQHLS